MSPSTKPTQVMNFLWLGLDLPAKPDPADGSINQPIQPHYIESIQNAARLNPGADYMLWVDSKRLTEKQLAYLHAVLETDAPNVTVKDLRSIPAYDSEKIYNEGETEQDWRDPGQTSMIWRQVDCAKILISLQGNYDQTFFADLDRAHMDMNAHNIQTIIATHGLMVGASTPRCMSLENQVWGFNPTMRSFFEEYYTQALAAAYDGENGYETLVRKLSGHAASLNYLSGETFLAYIAGDKTEAEHPGHAWRNGSRKKFEPHTIDKDTLTASFEAAARYPRNNRHEQTVKQEIRVREHAP